MDSVPAVVIFICMLLWGVYEAGAAFERDSLKRDCLSGKTIELRGVVFECTPKYVNVGKQQVPFK